jgi:hypothetical protein
MSSSSKRRQTMAKMTRERALQEKRERKQEKKEAKKQLAAEAQNAEGQGIVATDDDVAADDVDDVPSNVLADSER